MKQAHEFKVIRIRECAVEPSIVDTPQRAFDYWMANIATADWFDPSKEAFVVLVLNTRRRIIGHNLVTLGILDTCLMHPREVFRPVIVAAGSNHKIPAVGTVAEVRYLYAFRESGCLYQPTYLGPRNDISQMECLVGQLKFKAGDDDES